MSTTRSDVTDEGARPRKGPRVIRTLAPQVFLEKTDEEVDRAVRYDRPLSVLMIQLQGVLGIRKEEGPEVAEEAVAAAAEIIARALRRIDQIGRLGVGEFGILLPETRLGSAEKTAIRLRDCFEKEPIVLRSGPRQIILNIGVSTVNPRLRNAKTFLMLACQQLREARRKGDGEISTVPAEIVRVSVARNGSIH
ncbi:MAG: diguanylate cyclase [Pseudomonadota bacterium]